MFVTLYPVWKHWVLQRNGAEDHVPDLRGYRLERQLWESLEGHFSTMTALLHAHPPVFPKFERHMSRSIRKLLKISPGRRETGWLAILDPHQGRNITSIAQLIDAAKQDDLNESAPLENTLVPSAAAAKTADGFDREEAPRPATERQQREAGETWVSSLHLLY